MAKKYTKSYSNYILKANPSPTKSGYVYENDLPTTGQKYNSVNGSTVTSTDGGFTFVINSTPNDSRTYNIDGWGQKTYTLSDVSLTNNDFKSINNSNVKAEVKQQKYVKLNKSYTDLSDYCYFGSSNAMLRASIDDIILNFPAAIYLKTTDNSIIVGDMITILVSDIENKFFIDLFDYYPDERVNLVYNLKTMASSYMNYEVVLEDESLIGYVTGFTGYTTTNQTQISFKLDRAIGSVGSLLVRPVKSKRDEFFNNLDDFQLALLDQYSIPKYKSYFKIPKDGENGVEFEYKSFNWATTDGYNIDISSSSYAIFMSDLIDATNFIDEIYNDNLYRMLTHDTIKNLDTTYTRDIDEDALEEIIIGGTKIQNLLRLYGRSFDELKKYIEGISFANTVTLSSENNLPTEYLPGKLEVCGWDVFSLLNEVDSSKETVSNLFPSTDGSYNADYVSSEILRRLIVNSNHIFKSKGTKKSIRKILGILGFEKEWYVTREYIQTVDGLIGSNELEAIAELNYSVYPANYSTADGKPEFEYSVDQSLFDNTNIGVMVKCPYCGSEDYIVSGDTNGDMNTGICINNNHIFNITGSTFGYPKPMINSTDYYFQQKGNWYRETSGSNSDLSGNTSVVDISYGNNPHIGNGEYDNGYDYVNQFEDVFKRYVRGTGEGNLVPLSGYTGVGFKMSLSKKINDTKIEYHDNSYSTGDTKGLLDINLKNFVVGIDGGKVLQSFFDNGGAQKITLNSLANRHDITGNENEFVNIVTSGDLCLLVGDYLDQTKSFKFKVQNSPSSESEIEFTYTNYTIGGFNDVTIQIPIGTTYLIQFDIDTLNWSVDIYNGVEEFNTLKSIALPYLEQLIPSTAIFDFMLIEKDKPKWLLVDEYCERDSYGNFTGFKIIAYQNVNYFDDSTSGPNWDLTGDTIPKHFGEGFIYLPGKTISKQSVLETENNNLFIMENGDYSFVEDNYGYDNVYFFRKESEDCGLNTDPIWVVN